MRVNTTFCQFVAGFQYLSVHNFDSGTIGNQISFGLTGFIIGNDNLTFFLGILNDRNPSELSDNRKSFGLSGLKKLLNTGKTLCDIITGNTAGMEGDVYKRQVYYTPCVLHAVCITLNVFVRHICSLKSENQNPNTELVRSVVHGK